MYTQPIKSNQTRIKKNVQNIWICKEFLKDLQQPKYLDKPAISCNFIT